MGLHSRITVLEARKCLTFKCADTAAAYPFHFKFKGRSSPTPLWSHRKIMHPKSSRAVIRQSGGTLQHAERSSKFKTESWERLAPTCARPSFWQHSCLGLFYSQITPWAHACYMVFLATDWPKSLEVWIWDDVPLLIPQNRRHEMNGKYWDIRK